MPRKPRTKHPVRDLRTIIKKTQREFAAVVGVSASALKRIENKKLPLSAKTARRIKLAAGVDDKALLNGKLRTIWGSEFKVEDYRQWNGGTRPQNAQMARDEAAKLLPWIEILFLAAAVGSKRRLWQVSEAVIDAVDACREDFDLTSVTDDILKRDYQAEDKESHYAWHPQGRGDAVARLWREKRS